MLQSSLSHMQVHSSGPSGLDGSVLEKGTLHYTIVSKFIVAI